MCCYLCTGMVKYANHSTVCLDVLTVLRPMTCANGMMEETQSILFSLKFCGLKSIIEIWEKPREYFEWLELQKNFLTYDERFIRIQKNFLK